MRIGLDFRFLVADRSGLDRGIARFTQQQLQSVLQLDDHNSYLLLCDHGSDLGAIRPEIVRAPNVQVVCGPDDALWTSTPWHDEPTLLRKLSVYQHWIEGLRLDLYHATSPLSLTTVVAPGFDVCPYVVTAYDLIPLLHPARYLGEGPHADAYRRGLLFLEQATRLAAISEATATDLVEHLGVPRERIDITPPSVSSCFRIMPPAVTGTVLASLDHGARRAPRRRVRIPAEYVLCIAALHYTKNLTTLLQAYADLPDVTRERFPLVIGGHLEPDETELVWQRAESFGIVSDLLLTGRLSDEELAAVYNGATLLVHPSHHEGFGLPVVEAMRSGVPVITTTRSSLPEVAGDAAVLIDSDDRHGFTEAIESLLHDRPQRLELRRRGLAQAVRFTDAALGESTLRCYLRAMVRTQTPAPRRVALWSPVPPQLSGIADYTDDLVAGLSARGGLELELFVDDCVMPPLQLMRAAQVHHHSAFERRQRQAPFDVILYQLGASVFHVYMEDAMLRHPGAVVIHDLEWSRSVLADRLGRPGGAQRFREEVAALEGEPAARRWDGISALPPHARHQAQREFLDAHPMLGRVIDAARTCIALTPEIADELRRRYPEADVRLIPMGVRDPSHGGAGFDRATARAYVGLDPRAFVVAVLGLVDPVKHIDAVLQSFAELRLVRPDALLTIVGWIPNPAYEAELRATAERLGIAAGVRVTGRVPRESFNAYTVGCDVAVALRDPGLRQMSAAVTRVLAAGRCAVISDVPAWRSIPNGACVRVPTPPAEQAALTHALISIATDDERRDSLERAARAHYEQAARHDSMAGAYIELIDDLAPRATPAQPAAAPLLTRQARMGRTAPRRAALAYNKVCELEDFSHPQLLDVIRDVCSHKRAVFGGDYPHSHEHRKDWEIAMAVRALADHGAVRPDARILGVAAGTEDTVFHLTRHVAEVVAVDRYLAPGAWTATAPAAMLVDPARLAPFWWRPAHLTVRHMDARVLAFADESFDGIFSSGSIEHFGDLQTVAAASYEMGRVLKPGGVLTLSTEILLNPTGGGGAALPGTLLLSPGEVRRFIVEASGLEPVDDLELSVSHWTLATERDITAAIIAHHTRVDGSTNGSARPEWTCWDLPHIVLDNAGRRFTSVHLTLRRSPVHPARDNAWARPSPELRAAVTRAAMDELRADAAPASTPNPQVEAATPVTLASDVSAIAAGRAATSERLTRLRGEVDAATGAVARAITREAERGTAVSSRRERSTARRARKRQVAAREIPTGAVACPIASPLTPPYTVLVEQASDDPISAAYRNGYGAGVNAGLVSLALAVVPRGGTFIDLGANVGSISLPVAAAGRRVMAVEAASVNVELLRASVALSGLARRMRVVANSGR